MSLHSNFLTLFIVLSSFSSCFGSYQEDPLGYPKAYTTTSKRAVQDRKFKTENFGRTTRLARASTPSTSPKLVSVDDFGAKGDGGDDTEVPHSDKLLVFGFSFSFLGTGISGVSLQLNSRNIVQNTTICTWVE
jgi:hypothetical protein